MGFVAAIRHIKSTVAELNYFENAATRTNPVELRTAIIATRFYIILTATVVFILVLFTGLGQQTLTVTIRNPSENVFEELHSKYSTTLQCPCTQVQIPYEIFINTSYKLHPVCSSVFVSNIWINLLFNHDMGYYFPLDFRSSASGQFQLLASLCFFINRTIQDATDDFLSNALLSPQALSSDSLSSQSEARGQFLRTTTTYTFRRLLNLVRDTTQMNSLQPAMQTSKMHLVYVYPDLSLDVSADETIWPTGHGENYKECYCGVTANCFSPSGFFHVFAYESEGYFQLPVRSSASINGFVVGCYALEALLHSSLECFFDETCLSTVLTYFPTSNITSLDVLSINQTQYVSETTMEALVDDLFLEDWSLNNSFSAYYSTCAPVLCTYKITQRNSFFQILTTLLGLYGGLTVVLRFCVPRAVRWWRNRKLLLRTEPQRRASLLIHAQNVRRTIKVQMVELNIFHTEVTRTDPYELQTARFSTRIYLFSLLVVLGIITVYLLSATRVHTVTFQSPSRTLFENLQNKYANTLQCPCRHIVIPYGSFTSFSPTYHPICSSQFINDSWIISISGLNTEDSVFDALDFRTAGPTFFNTLATLCSLSEITINDAWYIFNQTPLITGLTLIESEFKVRSNLALEQFQNNSISDFKSVLSLVDMHTQTMYATGYENLLLVTNQTAAATTPIDFGWIPSEDDICSCGVADQCADVMSFFNYTDDTVYATEYLEFTLPDIFIGCYVVPSVLQSSLGCFFNQTCLDIVQNAIKTSASINISILEANTTRFSPQALIATLLDNLMIEAWNENIRYDQYYEQCDPEQCTYTYTSHNNLLQIVTTLFGLFGGLSVALQMIVPTVVRWIRKRLRSRGETNNTTDLPRPPARTISAIWHLLKDKILKLNLFKTELSWDDDRLRRRQIITTRIYLLTLVVAVIALIIYTLIDTQSRIVTVLSPSQQQFDQLRFDPQSSATLDCSCQNIIVPYNSFISIEPRYHQLCSSDFVASNSTWIYLLYSSEAGEQYAYDDFRLFAMPQFRLLMSLCTLAKETINEAINQFSANIVTNERVQPRETIETQANSTLNQFLLSTPRTFIRTLDFIRYMAQGNGIVSTVLSNWHFLSGSFHDEYPCLWAEPQYYGDDNCPCATNPMCTSQASFNGSNVPGFRVGCYPLEALLQSTLECLYNVTCIDQLKFMYNRSNITFNPLDATLSSPNMTVQSLIDELLVERWETSVVYEKYYATCKPVSCVYTFNGQASLVYTVTTIIGLFGGLSVALKVIIPLLVQIGHYVIMRHRHQVEPVVAVTTMTVILKY